jgi:hypothetical protein
MVPDFKKVVSGLLTKHTAFVNRIENEQRNKEIGYVSLPYGQNGITD